MNTRRSVHELIRDYVETLARVEGGLLPEDLEARLRSFRRFVTTQAHYLDQQPEWLFPLAMAQPLDSLVRDAAIALEEAGRGPRQPWLRLLHPAETDPNPALIRVLRFPALGMATGTVSDDGRIAMVGGTNGTIQGWDLETGKPLKCLESPQGPLGIDHLGEKRYRTPEISALAMSADGRIAVSGDDMGALRRWDLVTDSSQSFLELQVGGVTSVSLSADGRIAVSAGGSDYSIRCWDVETGRRRTRLEGHSDRVNCVALSADGRIALSGSEDQTVRLWDIESGICLATLTGHYLGVLSVALNADGRTGLSGGWDRTVRVIDTESRSFRAVMDGHADVVKALALSRDGRRGLSGSQDKTVRHWQLEQGRCEAILEGHEATITSASVASDGWHALTCAEDGTVRVWDLRKVLPAGDLTWSGRRRVTAVALSVDGRRSLSGAANGTIRCWDVETGRCEAEFEGHDGGGVFAFSNDGLHALSGHRDGALRWWDFTTAKASRLDGHEGAISHVALDRSSRNALSIGEDRTLRWWDLNSRRCRGTYPGKFNAIAISAEGKHALSAEADGALHWWQLEGDRRDMLLGKHADPSWGGSRNQIVLRGDGLAALLLRADGSAYMWDLGGQSLVAYTLPVELRRIIATSNRRYALGWSFERSRNRYCETQRQLYIIDTQTFTCSVLPASVDIRDLVYEDENALLVGDGPCVVWKSWQGNPRWFDLGAGVQGELQISLPWGGQRAVNADGRFLLLGTSYYFGNDRTPLEMVEIQSGRSTTIPVETGGVKGAIQRLKGVALSENGSRALAQTDDGRFHWWDIDKGVSCTIPEGHRGAVTALAISSDGTAAASGGDDSTVRCLDLVAKRCHSVMTGHHNTVSALDVTRDPKSAISTDESGLVCRWDLDSGVCDGEFGSNVVTTALGVDGYHALSWHRDGKVRWWDLDSGDCLSVHHPHQEPPRLYARSPDGTRVITWEGGLQYWDLATGRPIRQEGAGTGPAWADLPARSLDFTRQGRYAISHHYLDNKLTIIRWNLETEEPLLIFTLDPCECNSYRLSRDGRFILLFNEPYHYSWWPLFWIDLEMGVHRRVAEGLSLKSADISPDGQSLLFGNHTGTLFRWDARTDRCLAQFRGHKGSIESVTFGPDGSSALSSSGDQRIRIWDLATEECRMILSCDFEDRSIEVYRDGRFALAGSGDWLQERVRDPRGTSWHWFDLESGRCLASLRGYPLSVAFEALTAVAGGDDGRLHWWDLETGRSQSAPNGWNLTGIEVSSDGRFALTKSGGNHGEERVRWWDLSRREPRRNLGYGPDNVMRVAMGKYDGSVSLLRRGRPELPSLGKAELSYWSIEKGVCTQTIPCPEEIPEFAYSSACFGRACLPQHPYDTREVKVEKVHPRFDLIVRRDGVLRLLDRNTGRASSFPGDAAITAVSITPRPPWTVCVGDVNGAIRYFRIEEPHGPGSAR
jgi:WD40 repeat protein